jgi:hypothetical protein
MDGRVHDEPSSVASEKDQVIVDGPDAVAVTLTPEAAEETGHRLIAKAADAAGYRHFREPDNDDEAGHDAGGVALPDSSPGDAG